MIHLKNLGKTFGSTIAVNSLNLSVSHGEIFGFIGPNGAGKTTTIRMMAGLLAPSGGTIRINGINMAREPEQAKKQIGLIPDRPFLYEKLTGFEFLKFTADLYEVSSRDFAARAEKLLTMFGLLNRADELIEAYSHGMKQRLIMTSALLHEPPLLIVDEPMVGLDPRGIKMVRELFRTLSHRGVTIFISTHTLSLAEDVCNRIGIIDNGSLVATGTMEELNRAARTGHGNLEHIFLRLTEEES